MKFPGFIGGSYQSRSLAADAQRSMNLYPERVESSSGRNAAAMFTRPGFTLFCAPNAGPGRGLWAGENRLFAASGSHLFEVLNDATSNDRGSIGNDTNPVIIIPNGGQLGIISAGKFLYDAGSGPVQAEFNQQSGVVNTAGTAVTWVSGDEFLDAGPNGTLNIVAGEQIVINGTTYVVASVTDATHLVLTGSAGTQTGKAYSVGFLVGTVNTSGTAVTWASGDEFDVLHMAGASININGTSYTIASVTDATHLTLSSSAGTQTGVKYSSNPIVTASSGGYLDGYAVIADAFNSRTWRVSAIDDFSRWDEADFALKNAYPDNLTAIRTDHEEIYLWGSEESTEVWRNTGAANFPFERDPSAVMHYGSHAPYAGVRLGQGVAWLTKDQERGTLQAVYAQGYVPKRISTHAVEDAWRQYTKLTDATGYSKMENGHDLWIINFPTANHTWAYDLTEDQWHERGYWNGSGWDLQRAWFHAYVDLGSGLKHFVQDGQNGNIYVESEATTTDNGTAIHWQRTCPYAADEDENIAQFRFELDAASGLGSPKLDWSDDKGASYGNQLSPRPPVKLKNGYQYTWARLGAGKHRIYRLQGTGPAYLINTYLRAAAGAK